MVGGQAASRTSGVIVTACAQPKLKGKLSLPSVLLPPKSLEAPAHASMLAATTRRHRSRADPGSRQLYPVMRYAPETGAG